MRMKLQAQKLQKSWTLIIQSLIKTSGHLIEVTINIIKSVTLSDIILFFHETSIKNNETCKCNPSPMMIQ
jgi:hypothetical protein